MAGPVLSPGDTVMMWTKILSLWSSQPSKDNTSTSKQINERNILLVVSAKEEMNVVMRFKLG